MTPGRVVSKEWILRSCEIYWSVPSSNMASWSVASRVANSLLIIRCLLNLADLLLHLQPWRERDDLLGGNHHALAGAWVAGFPRFSLFDLEDAEIAEFDAAF